MVTIHDLVRAVVLIIVAGLIFGLLYWLIRYVELPEPFAKVAKIVLMVFGVLVLICILLSLVGYPLVVW